jgi:MFS family permease
MTTAAIPNPAITVPNHGHRPGTIRAAFAYRDYRIIWCGMFASNIGTWMQNLALPAYIQKRTDSGGLVGLMVFAQLGPMLLLAIPGGVLASRVRSRPLLVGSQSAQMLGSLVLALLVWKHASIPALFFANLCIGISVAIAAPAFQAALPGLVHRQDLSGVVALNSVQINASRVIGPVLAALLGIAGVTTSQLFVINAATYPFIIAAFLSVTLPPPRGGAGQGWRQLTVGIHMARGRKVLGRLLLTMTSWSFLSLGFVGLFPTIAHRAFGLDPLGSTYRVLYSIWGLGALLGAITNGTVLAHVPKRRVIPAGFLGFAISLAAFGLCRSTGPAYAAGAVLGYFYFLTASAMVTEFQMNVTEVERPFLMSLWFMAFGGTIPLGNLVVGPLMDHIGPRPILLVGAAFALVLARWCDLRRLAPTDFLDHPLPVASE